MLEDGGQVQGAQARRVRNPGGYPASRSGRLRMQLCLSIIRFSGQSIPLGPSQKSASGRCSEQEGVYIRCCAISVPHPAAVLPKTLPFQTSSQVS